MGATEIWLVRHGESVANVIASAAQEAGEETIDVGWRDADVPLSPTGEKQAVALGRWIADHSHYGVPSAVWSSSYLRARQTIELALAEAGLSMRAQVDERLRDRELGVLDLLTAAGVEARFPAEAARRRWLGKLYYRPPGGESWADVALRVRSFLQDIDADDDSRTVLVVAHDAVVMLFLYVCDELSEEELIDFTLTHVVTNASVTRLVRPTGKGRWQSVAFAEHGHLDRLGVETTEHPGDTEPGDIELGDIEKTGGNDASVH
ncbi:histidine phosphatase family protein [Herbiconiux sp. CPCC 205763]|uniref:phosphoglycerate mutase (2,3-diphosphoglycerate-dependent) n=1 Tax=Herbiconiux aconitum TaxID=2970913 RepID=A0ABT2GUW9_9MICO|nr:histidine phosphatase family protein [Herbiconiux aconitum]MCS5718729.1 histidine phosphatase family protein [Herbiconiux aconitum]